MRKIILLVGITCLSLLQISAQVYTNKVVGEKNEAYIDSLKVTEYLYVLPIWGAKAAARGFDLPYPAGLGINYLWQQSDLIIEDLFVGFNNGPMYDLDELIRFDNAISAAAACSIGLDYRIN